MPRAKPRPEVPWAERRYRRTGGGYLWLFPLVIVVTALIDAVLGTASAILILDLAPGRYWSVLWPILLTILAWLAVFLVWSPLLMRPVVRWVRGRRDVEHAPEVWRSATSGLGRLVSVGMLTFGIASIPAMLAVSRLADLPLTGILLAALAAQLFVAGAAVVNYIVFEALLRPVLRDVSRLLPADFEVPPRRLTLTARLLGASLVITAFAGILLIGATSRVEQPLTLLATGMGILVFVTLVLALPLSALLARSVVSPVEQLLRASREVRAGRLNARVPLTSSDELGTLSQSFNEMVQGLRERETLHSAMGSYVHPVIARRVMEEGELIAGVEADATLLFLDVRGFTAAAGEMEAAEAVAFLNRLFALVVPVVDRHGGHVNKFLGDGFLAVFGAPEELENHADRAVEAAREIVARVDREYRGAVRVGIGVNTGPVVAGTIGGGAHLEFGLIGDTVNVAARLEQLTKEGTDSILITEATRDRLNGTKVSPRGAVRIRGKALEIQVYAVPQPGEPAKRAARSTSARGRGSAPTPRPRGTRSRPR